MNSITPRFAATMQEEQQAGAVWLDCVKGGGAGAKTRIHCVGDAGPWIHEQWRQGLGEQASYKIEIYQEKEVLATG